MEPNERRVELRGVLRPLARQMRDRFLRQPACTRKHLCGLWKRAGADLTLRIYDSPRHDGYGIDISCRNGLDTHERVYTHALEQDAQGNLFFGPFACEVIYLERHDKLLTEHFGIFERHKT